MNLETNKHIQLLLNVPKLKKEYYKLNWDGANMEIWRHNSFFYIDYINYYINYLNNIWKFHIYTKLDYQAISNYICKCFTLEKVTFSHLC